MRPFHSPPVNLGPGIRRNSLPISFYKNNIPPGTKNTDVGGTGMEISGSDNTTGGFNLILSNHNPGASAYVDLYMQNDLADASAANFAVLNLNSSGYNDNTFGAIINVPNQLGLYGTAGPTLIGAASSSSNGFLSFFTGGTATSNERMRITNTGGTTIGAITALNRTARTALMVNNTVTTLNAQNVTPTAAQLLGGAVKHTTQTAGGTFTLDTGTNISAAVTGVSVGDTFTCLYINNGNQTGTITTAASGTTLFGTAAVTAGKIAVLTFSNTGSNAWDVYITVSA